MKQEKCLIHTTIQKFVLSLFFFKEMITVISKDALNWSKVIVFIMSNEISIQNKCFLFIEFWKKVYKFPQKY